MRSHRLLLLTATFLVAAVPAQARVYDLPTVVGGKLAALTRATPLPVLLPQTLPLDYSKKVFATTSGHAKSWLVDIDAVKNCGGANACFLAAITARKGGKPSNPHKVTLTGGTTGYFQPLSCGGSCSPPSIQFKRSGVLYEIQARVVQKHRSDRSILVAAANSAITNGPR